MPPSTLQLDHDCRIYWKRGLGFYIQIVTGNMRPDLAFAGIFLLTIMGLSLFGIVTFVERLLSPGISLRDVDISSSNFAMKSSAHFKHLLISDLSGVERAKTIWCENGEVNSHSAGWIPSNALITCFGDLAPSEILKLETLN